MGFMWSQMNAWYLPWSFLFGYLRPPVFPSIYEPSVLYQASKTLTFCVCILGSQQGPKEKWYREFRAFSLCCPPPSNLGSPELQSLFPPLSPLLLSTWTPLFCVQLGKSLQGKLVKMGLTSSVSLLSIITALCFFYCQIPPIVILYILSIFICVYHGSEIWY